jgi:uncharacterized membrane protein YgcG
MDIWSAIPIPLFLLVCAAVLMGMHARTWRSVQEREMEAAERDYHWRQFRRRMQSSAMLGVLAVGIFVGQWVSEVARPAIVFIFWGGVALLVLWVAVLAVTDILATKYYYGRLRQGFLVEQAKLQARLRRMEEARRNGRGGKRGRKSGSEGRGAN